MATKQGKIMTQHMVDDLITKVNRIKDLMLSNSDVDVISEYLKGETDYDYFSKWFDSKVKEVEQSASKGVA